MDKVVQALSYRLRKEISFPKLMTIEIVLLSFSSFKSDK